MSATRLESLAAIIALALSAAADAQTIRFGPQTISVGDAEGDVVSTMGARYMVELVNESAGVRYYSVAEMRDHHQIPTHVASLFFEGGRLTEVRTGIGGEPHEVWSAFLDAIAQQSERPSLEVEREEDPKGQFPMIRRRLSVVYPSVRLEFDMWRNVSRSEDVRWGASLDTVWSIDPSRPYDIPNLEPKAP